MSDVKIQPLTLDWYDRWNDFVDQHEAGWFWQRTEWLDYLTVYYPGTKALSFLLVEGEEIKTICPLLFERGKFLGGGIPLPRPLFRSFAEIPVGFLGEYLGVYSFIFYTAPSPCLRRRPRYCRIPKSEIRYRLVDNPPRYPRSASAWSHPKLGN